MMKQFYTYKPKALVQLRAVLFALSVIVVLSCQTISPDQTPSPTVSRAEQGPRDQEIEYVLKYTGDIFYGEDWRREYEVEPLRVDVTWHNNSEEAVAYLAALFYESGYSQGEIDEYFSDESYRDIILSYYQDPKQLNSCAIPEMNLALHEYSAIHNGEQYSIRSWIKPDTDTRILHMMLIFPSNSKDVLDLYALDLFPELPMCPK